MQKYSHFRKDGLDKKKDYNFIIIDKATKLYQKTPEKTFNQHNYFFHISQ